MVEILTYVFYVCLGIGIGIPLLSVLFGVFGSLVDLEFDFGTTPGDFGTDSGFSGNEAVPVNLMCLCFSLVVFGAIGRLTLPYFVHTLASIGILVALIALSFGAYLLTYRYIVKPLQNNSSTAMRSWDVIGAKGKLTLRITQESPGVVSLKDSTGAAISYRATARPDTLISWNGIIPQGAEVIVVDLDESAKMTFVRPLDTFENHKLNQSFNTKEM